MIKRANINWTAKQYGKMIEKGNVTFDNEVQRAYVWDLDRKTLLISSMLEGYPVPAIYARKTVDGKYDVLDGQQRSKTIKTFLNDEFELGELELEWASELENETRHYNLTGKKFSELDDDMKDALNGYSLTVYYFDGITDEETSEMFRRLNNGKPLTAKEKNVAYCKDIATVTEISKHVIFDRLMSAKAMERKSYVGLIMKVWAMLNMDVEDLDFSGSKFNELISIVTISEEEKAEINKVLSFMDESLVAIRNKDKNVLRKVKKEINFVSLIPVVSEMMEYDMNAETFADFCVKFFNSNDENYAEACANGTAKNASITTRNDVLMDELMTFIEELEELEDSETVEEVIEEAETTEEVEVEVIEEVA